MQGEAGSASPQNLWQKSGKHSYDSKYRLPVYVHYISGKNISAAIYLQLFKNDQLSIAINSKYHFENVFNDFLFQKCWFNSNFVVD